MNDYTPITGVGNSGDFVLNSQEIAKDQGFNHVSKLWYDKTKSFEDGLEQLEDSRGMREDLLVKLRDINFSVSQQGKFVVGYGDREFVPTDHAMTQLVMKAVGRGTSYASHLRGGKVDKYGESVYKSDAGDAEALSVMVNNGVRRLDDSKKYRLRTYTDGTLRAFLTEKYAEIDNRWYLELLSNIIPNGRLSHWRGDADTVYGNILIPDTIREESDSDYGGMISVGNCEIGKRRISQIPSLFRAICMNGCIWDQAQGMGIKKVHLGKIDLEELATKIRINIEAQIPLLPDGIERFLGIRSMECGEAKVKQVVAAISVNNKFNSNEATEILTQWVQHERDDRNLFGIVNAVTRAGQEFDNEKWVKFDEIGGRLATMGDKQWDKLVTSAATIDEDDLAKVYAIN